MAPELFDRLRLIRSAHVGPVTYARLMNRFGDATEALRYLGSNQISYGSGRAIRIASKHAIELELDALKTLGAKLLFLGDNDYPRLLQQTADAPPVLICQGELELLDSPAIAIVGARNASAASCRFARELADGLTNRGVVVVSGLARGIDTAAHQGALRRATIAVVAGGMDIYYPPENEQLQRDISHHGLVISEQSPGTEPRARHFPFRNRIIAGLTLGTVVVEAAPRSGSLITARLASEAGRHVMAVPGAPYDPRSQGCNSLIRDGATLVQSADEVLEQMLPLDDRAELTDLGLVCVTNGPEIVSGNKTNISREVNSGAEILPMLGMSPVSIDELVRQSRHDAADVHRALMELELAGQLQRHAGGRVSLKLAPGEQNNLPADKSSA